MITKHGKFYADWRDEAGRHRVAFGTAKEAIKHKNRMQQEFRARKAQGIGSVAAELRDWINSLPEGRDRKSRNRWHERTVAKHLNSVVGQLPASKLNSLMVSSVIEELKRIYSVPALYNLRFRLKQFCSWLEERGIVKGLSKKVPRTPTPQPRHVLIQPEELKKLKEAAAPWLRCFILFCFDGGLRRAEALRISFCNYSQETGRITVEVKNRRMQSFEATEELRNLLAMVSNDAGQEASFLSLLRGGPVAERTIERAWNNLKRRTKVNPALYTHDLRRTAATELYLRTKNIGICQAFLGHANPITTLRYIIHSENFLIRPHVEEMKLAFTRRTSSGSIVPARSLGGAI